MKITRLETHDRHTHFIKDQSAAIFQGAEDCLKKNSLSLVLQDHSPYIYMFAHPRTADDGVNKRLLWQPRLTRPDPQTNSFLFRAKSKSSDIEVCWLLPPRELWPEYKKGNICESNIALWSIEQFTKHREDLAKPHEEDLPLLRVKQIYLFLKKDNPNPKIKILMPY